VAGSARARAALVNEQRQGLLASAIFAAAALISIVVIGLAGRGQTLKGDEWGYAHRLATLSLPDAMFNTPPGKYLLVLPMLFYKFAFSTIGISDYVPYRLVGMGLTIAAAILFLILAGRRIGYLLALPGAVLIIFLGSASEVTSTPLRIAEQIAVVAGLGVLLALERRDLRGDVAACLLLVISITSHPLGTAFAAAAAVLVLARPAPGRWRRAWVFAIPVLLFAAWYLALREAAPDSVSLGTALKDVPRFEFQSLAAMAAAVTGVFRSPFDGQIDALTPLSYTLAVIILAAVGVRASTTRPSPMFWALLAAILVLFAAPAFAPGALRAPDSSRYIFTGVIVLLLLVCEAFRGFRPRGVGPRIIALACLTGVFGLAIYSNATVLDRHARIWGGRGIQVKAELTALDLAQGRVAPSFQPEDASAQPPVPSTHSGFTAEQYFRTKAAYGSPALSPSELQTEPALDREVADVVLARALGLQLRPMPSMRRSAKAPRPRIVATDAKSRSTWPSCITLTPNGGPASSQVELPANGVALSTSGGGPVDLALGRFSAGYGYELHHLQPHGAALLFVPPDTDPTPWRLLIRPVDEPVTICGLDVSKFGE
jgi:hypothetical protein